MTLRDDWQKLKNDKRFNNVPGAIFNSGLGDALDKYEKAAAKIKSGSHGSDDWQSALGSLGGALKILASYCDALNNETQKATFVGSSEASAACLAMGG